MRRIEFTPKARHDIEDIWDYSLERFGFDRAETYLREIQRAAETVAEDPRRGSCATAFGLAIESSRSARTSCFTGSPTSGSS